jgi:hypothetical protein
MSTGSPQFERRQKALKAVRRYVRRLEIETHRIKAHLARLEADCEEDTADWLSRKLRRRLPTAKRLDVPPGNGAPQPHASERAATQSPEESAGPITAVIASASPTNTLPAIGLPPPAASATQAKVDSLIGNETITAATRPTREKASPVPRFFVSPTSAAGISTRCRQSSQAYRQTTSPLLLSFAVHAVGLLLCLTFGFATLVQQAPKLFASPADFLDDSPEEFNEVKIESSKLDDDELQNVLSESDDFNIAKNSLREFEPNQVGAGAQALGEIGQLDALPSELGTLLAGAGSTGSGPPGGELGQAVFFGTRSHGNRIVFVVDNSSSMKDGRFETAIAELVRCVEALSPRQAFYVILVSDQPYPMFYPQPAANLLPATAANKKRLAEWLPRALLASGKNRELIKAMDLAASLQPDAVYLLWDGDMRYSEKVRLEVMTHLTRPNQWSFLIHTLGMGITSLDAEYNLTAIANAHGGTYRRVDVPTDRSR